MFTEHVERGDFSMVQPSTFGRPTQWKRRVRLDKFGSPIDHVNWFPGTSNEAANTENKFYLRDEKVSLISELNLKRPNTT